MQAMALCATSSCCATKHGTESFASWRALLGMLFCDRHHRSQQSVAPCPTKSLLVCSACTSCTCLSLCVLRTNLHGPRAACALPHKCQLPHGCLPCVCCLHIHHRQLSPKHLPASTAMPLLRVCCLHINHCQLSLRARNAMVHVSFAAHVLVSSLCRQNCPEAGEGGLPLLALHARPDGAARWQ